MASILLIASPLILSGVGGSSNWFPLLFPLIAIFAIIYVADVTIKFIKRKKLQKQQLINMQAGEFTDLTEYIDGNN